MRDVSHKTWIAIVLDHVNAWRKANGWSRETVVQMIVEAHDRMNGQVVTGIKFEPHTADTFERWKVNADRVFRWLDDVTKDTNTCPPNFIPSILAALPMDRRMALVNRWLQPLDISCRPLDHVDDGATADAHIRYFKDLVRTSAEAQTSVADLLDGINPGELERAHAALCESMHSIQHEMALVEQRLAEQRQPESQS